MQITYETAWYPTPPQQVIIQAHMARFQAVKRYAFNRLLDSQPRQAIVQKVRELGLLSNARYIRSAIEEGKAALHAQQELVQLYSQETTWKVRQAQQELKRYQQSLTHKQAPLSKKQYQKLTGLHKRLQKAQADCTKWQAYRTNRTIPRVVFGGKKNLQLYQQGKLSKKEWSQRRNNGIYCVGEANKQGNANLRLHYDSQTERFSFSMLLDRGRKNDRLIAYLYVPSKYKALVKQLAQGKTKYTVRVRRSFHGPFYRVLITIEQHSEANPNTNGIAGLDLNPMGLAVTVVYSNGNYRCSRWFPCPELLYAQKGKRNWVIGQVVKRALTWVISLRVNTISLEELQFSKQFGANRTWNRLRANFVHKKFLQTIQSQAIKQQLCFKTVNPAYTSILGQYKYHRCYGLNTHQAAALVIARRGLGMNEKLYTHTNGHQAVLVVPPMEGWTNKQIRWFAREIDEFTARLSNPTSKVQVGSPRLITRRQGSGGGIVPRDHILTPGKDASVPSDG